MADLELLRKHYPVAHVYRPLSTSAFDPKVDESRCRHAVHQGGRMVGFYQCTRKPTTTACGFGFCRQHFFAMGGEEETVRAQEKERKRKEKEALQCAESVYRDGWTAPCSKPGRHIEKGKRWCHLHAPSKVAAKRKAEKEEWDQQDRRHKKRYRISDLRHKIVDLCLKTVKDLPPNVAVVVEDLREAQRDYDAGE